MREESGSLLQENWKIGWKTKHNSTRKMWRWWGRRQSIRLLLWSQYRYGTHLVMGV